ncbi:MAG TPA: VWA domain-containing protein [Eggerthellaceae bacterium]|nr:VWA domain-containing protein [Eggerthellaceae bacterium]
MAIVLAVSLSVPSTAFANDNSSSNDFWSDPIGTIASFFGVSTQNVSSDDPDAYTVDGDTKDTMTLGESNSTRYDGRVWVDKSVSASDVSFGNGNLTGDGVSNGNVTIARDSDFLVTYSALAASTQVSGKSNVPIDTVFVIDISGSMLDGMGNGQTRIEALVDALNESIDSLMNMNDQNRVAVVVYSGEASVFLPLDHYTKANNGSGYFSVNKYGSTYINYNVRDSNNQIQNGSKQVTGGTNIHMGVDTGMDALLNEEETTATISGVEVQRVPSLILLSDGSPTYSGADSGNKGSYVSWWDPSGQEGTGYSASQSGYSQGNEAYEKFAMKTIMNAAYNKQQVSAHYGVTGTDYDMRVYTVGLGLSQLGTTDQNTASLTLNPTEYLSANNTISNAVRSQWNNYLNNEYANLDGYTFQHPSSGDITSVAYNDGYYSANNADEITSVFEDIVSDIAISVPSVPTQVSDNDPVHDGYITFTDTTGAYMEIKDVKALIWSNTVFAQESKTTSANGDTTTYTFAGEINSPAYGEHNANEIIITITDNGDNTQTIEVKIPASAIPLRVNTVSLDSDGGVVSYESNDAMPLRLVYSVGLEDNIDVDTLSGVSEDYIAANTVDGKVNFYSNAYTAADEDSGATESIGAQVTFTPASTNPFYYFQEDTPIYTQNRWGEYEQATSFSKDETYYIPVTYYKTNQEITEYVERSGADLADFINYEHIDGEWWGDPGDDLYYVKAGSPRLGNLSDLTADKDSNETGTASTYREPTWDSEHGQFVVFLGNNGKLQLDAPSSLTIAKKVTADSGLTAPDKTFTFDVTIADKADTEGVKAILHTAGADDQEVTLNFDENGKAQVISSDGSTYAITLKANQSLEIPNMGNTDYTVVEQYASNNTGFSLTKIEGASTTNDVDSATASGTVGTDDATVTFTNNYSVSSVTTDELNINLGGTKTITGRDFQSGDTFTFIINAAGATPNAPLPTIDVDEDGSATTATIAPDTGTSATFEFGDITFNAPGEYRYIITEVDPNNDGNDQTTGLGGVDYDSAIYRINIVIVDSGDGKLRLATTDEIADMTTQGNLEYTANPMVQLNNGQEMVAAPNNAVAFENSYSSASTTSTIQGTKVLNVSNSSYTLADNDFSFEIEALGSTIETKDSYDESDFANDATQPQPTAIQAANIANGNVQFSFAANAFTQDMVGKIFGYKVTEVVPSDTDSETEGVQANGITYDTSEQIVWITVSDDGAGNVVATVAPNTATQGQTANNFTFTNSYTPTTVTIGDQSNAGIAVQKTFTGHEWFDTYSFDFTLAASSNTAGIDVNAMPMPQDDEISIGNPESGTINTAVFGEMTFKKAGTYTYTITETKGTNNGITYDGHTATVTVTVTENTETGALSAQVSYDNSNALNDDDKAVNSAAAFTNTYSATFDAGTAVSLSGTKNVDVADGFTYTLNNGSYWFNIIPLNGAPGVADTGSVGNTGSSQVQDTNDWTSSIALLNNVSFSMSDMGGQTSKTFEYIVTEQIPDQKLAGITYDETAYKVTITVTDDGEGTLSADDPVIQKGSWDDVTFTPAAEGVEADAVVFTNSYSPTSTTVAAQAITKTLNGGTPAEGAYSFTLSVVSANPNDGIALSEDTTISNDASGKVQFGDITFSKPGTYVVKVTETIPANAINPDVNGGATTYENATDEEKATAGWTLDGVTYDANIVQTTFTVRDINGTLAATRTSHSGNLTFANTYEAEGELDGATNLSVTKTIDGRSFQDGDNFTFTLTAGNEDTQTAIDHGSVILPGNAASGITISYADGDNVNSKSAAFGNITFTAEGNYQFNITEVVPDDATNPNVGEGATTYENATDEQKALAGWTLNGVTYDNQPHVVTVSATDNGNGVLTVQATNGSANPTITNTYKPSGDVTLAEGAFELTKILQGKEWNGDTFTFELTGVSAKTPDGSDITSIPMPSVSTATVSAASGETTTGDDSAIVTFGSITFNTIGTYTYEVREVVPQVGDENYNAGITYDNTTVATIVVAVTDNLNGGLAATVTSQQNTTFTNTYSSELEYNTAGGINIVKNLTGANLTETNPFTFTVTPVESADGNTAAAETAAKLGLEEGGQEFSTHGDSNMDDNGISHESLSVVDAQSERAFTQADEGKTYTFTVAETNDNKAGYTYDGRTFTVTITTADDGQGGIKVTTNVVADDDSYKESFVYDNDATTENSQAIIPFNNTYNATGELGGNGDASLIANKTLDNADIADYEGAFTFNVTASNGTDTKTYATAQNAANGSIAFPAIEYSTESLIADTENGYCVDAVQDDGSITYTYTYQVSEVTTGLPAGITPTSAGFTVGVVVTDNGSGSLGIKVNYPDGNENGLAFENTYGADATASVAVGGVKTYDIASGATNAPDIAGQYTFTLTGTDESGNQAPLPNDATGSVTVTNQTSGAVSFGTITYGIDDMSGATENADGTRTKVFNYTVTESGNVAGVVNDQSVSRTFTVTLTDDGQGNLTAVSSETPGAQFSFTNSYTLTSESSSPTGNGGLTITKNLDGRNLSEGEFSFQMIGAAGTEAEGMNLTAANAADGSVSFGTLTFEKPGTYQFQISEVKGTLGGVGYDLAVYNATANVSDDGDGTLTVAWSFANAANEPIDVITFNNTYTASPTSVILGGTKVLDGRTLADGEFNFELRDADGNVLQTVANNAEGGIVFDKITYDAEGTYEYTISEVAGDAEGITYDDTTYTAKVVVTDDGQGSFKVSQLTYNDGIEFPLFTNTYTEPSAGGDSGEGPIEYLTKTSDTWLPYFLGIIAAAAAAVVGISLRKIQSAHAAPRGRHSR